MKLKEVFRFELGYQLRRPWTWVYFVALLGVILQITVEAYTSNARSEGYYFNAPFVISLMTFTASFMGLLATAGFAGDAAARDVQLRLYPLLYTSPLRPGTFLGGRFAAALALNALVLLSAPIALVVSTILPGVPQDLLGPARPGAYIQAYLLLALPNAFIATALLFSAAALSRRAIAGYLGAVVVFFTTLFVWLYVAAKLGQWTLAKALDPLALTVMSEISRTTTATQKNALSLIDFEWLLANRAIWVGIALAALAITHARFRFEQPATQTPWWRPWAPVRGGRAIVPPSDEHETVRGHGAAQPPVVVPRSKLSFAFASQVRQAIAIALYSFREIAISWGGLVLAALTLLLVIFGPKALSHMDIPLLPTTQQMTAFVGNTGEIVWTIIPLLTVFYAGELVSREREIGLSDIADATPAPEWSRFAGRFMGLVLLFVAYQAMLMLAAILIQVQRGYVEFELALYLKVLFGLQLIDHVLFAMLAITVHVLVNQKYVGYLVTLLALALVMFATSMGIEHKLLIYGSDTGWMYTDLRRFGPAIAPWLAFKLYWGTCAVLLAVVAKLFWVRGREGGSKARLRAARARLTRPTIGVLASAATLIATLGAFVLYNTNVLNAFETFDDLARRRVEYERLYKRFSSAPQPRLARTTLRAEIYPSQYRAELRGTYRLVNATAASIDSIHVAPTWNAETAPIAFDRPTSLALDDSTLGYRIFALASPLTPGDSVDMTFIVRIAPRGFTNGGIDASVSPNGTFLDAADWLPAIGYQRTRELADVGRRRELGLPPRPRIRSLDDVAARSDLSHATRVEIETIVGTEPGQIAVAPGALEREWTESGRRYFRYVTDTPVRNDFALFSAAYAMHEGKWVNPSDSSQTVTIQILHHPSHTKNPQRMIRSVQASLSTLTTKLGPYPHGQVRLVEHPGNGGSLHAYPVNISFEEEFSLLDSDNDPRKVDFPFAVVAHEMAHQWWGGALMGANVEGRALLSESLAWYSAMSVVEATYGTDHLNRLQAMFRDSYLEPRPEAAPPLLRAHDGFQGYRKGPFVMAALREYVGAASIDAALGRFLRAHESGTAPLPTSLDLYRELRTVTPDSLHSLLADLFETNTYWDLHTKRIAVDDAGAGTWRVTLDVIARKSVVDTSGFQTDVPMNDPVEIGVFGVAEADSVGKPLYLRQHRIRSGEQRIVVTVTGRPGSGGVDPRHLLIDVEPDDNSRLVGRGQTIRFR